MAVTVLDAWMRAMPARLAAICAAYADDSDDVRNDEDDDDDDD